MFLDFFYSLRRHKVPVSPTEWMTLMDALRLGLHDSSLDGFYRLARSLLVKDIARYDAFDAAFLEVFRGVEGESLALLDELEAWLANAREQRQLTAKERELLDALDLDALRRLFEERLREQTERHDGGSHWIGTGGTSPFGSRGAHPTGLRVGQGGGRSAMQLAEERRFRAYRNDAILDVRQIDVALRALRELGREGAPAELDLDETIDRTARNAGDIEVVFHPPRRNRTKVILLMDVGGSMDPYARMVERLFTAASRAGRFARFRHFYFHNCVYESVYEDAHFRRAVPVADLLHKSGRDERLVLVGDAAMHPAELLDVGGALYYYKRNARPGIEWIRLLHDHFRRAVWLNPEPEQYWGQMTIQVLASLFPMFPLTVEGLNDAVHVLTRGEA